MTPAPEKAAPIPADIQMIAGTLVIPVSKSLSQEQCDQLFGAIMQALVADREARPSLPDSREERDEFNRGYLIAVANVMNMHRDAVVASELLVQLGVTIDDAEALGLTDYDMDALKRLRGEPRAAPFFNRKRRARTRQGGNNG